MDASHSSITTRSTAGSWHAPPTAPARPAGPDCSSCWPTKPTVAAAGPDPSCSCWPTGLPIASACNAARWGRSR